MLEESFPLTAALVDRLIAEAREEVRSFVKPADQYREPKLVIARYTAAIAVNFTDWLGKTYPWARHEIAQYALKDNLRCEQSQDHVGMLLNFTKGAGVRVMAEDFEWVAEPVEAIRKLLGRVCDAGFTGLAILAILENTSQVFIPVLEEMGKTLGVTDLTYTRVHGEADVEHSDAFIKALRAEWTMGHRDTQALACDALDAVLGLLHRIFEEVPTTA